MTIFEEYQVARWRVGSFNVAFPAQIIEESGGNRIVRRERPFRNGAKLDSTGNKERVWRCQIMFDNSLNEEGISEINGGELLYPNVLNTLIQSFNVNETGSLFLPTVGEQRCKVEDFSRIETFENRDVATLSVIFVQDNEDTIDFETIARIQNVDANGRRSSEQTTFDAQSAGVWDSTVFEQYKNSLAELEDLANSPQETANDIDNANAKVVQSANRIVELHSKPIPGRDTFTGQRGSKTERELEIGKDMASRATNVARKGRPQIVGLQLLVDSSIAAISGQLQQDFDDLLNINPQIENPFFIPKNTIVKVFADAQTSR